MRPIYGIVKGVEGDSVHVKIRSGQRYTIKTEEKFSVWERVILLLSHETLKVMGLVKASALDRQVPVHPMDSEFIDDDDLDEVEDEGFLFPEE